MNPLSIFLYYSRNKRRALSVLGILVLAVFGISLSLVLTATMFDSARAFISPLLYLMSGLKHANEGRIIFDGRDYGNLGDGGLVALRRKRFGFIFQQHFLINYLTVLENVLVGALERDSTALTRAKELLAELGMEAMLKRFLWQLSIGQRQRVAIARALINNPAVVFADEPTASLDHATGYQVVELLARYRGKGSIVFVTHDPEMLSEADRVIRMRDGKIVQVQVPSHRSQALNLEFLS